MERYWLVLRYQPYAVQSRGMMEAESLHGLADCYCPTVIVMITKLLLYSSQGCPLAIGIADHCMGVGAVYRHRIQNRQMYNERWNTYIAIITRPPRPGNVNHITSRRQQVSPRARFVPCNLSLYLETTHYGGTRFATSLQRCKLLQPPTVKS
jgi:hypothetical protein